MKKADFLRWFNRSFWKAFSGGTLPISIPKSKADRELLLDEVYRDIVSARYAPGIPEIELVMNKGHGVARTIPVFGIRDYCVYYFCIKELEDVLCINRTANTFGGWSLGGQLRTQENHEIESDAVVYGRYSFNPKAWTQAFGEFNALLFAQIEPGHYKHVLQLDLANFYDCVRLDVLERWMREQARAEYGWVITLLFYLLNYWNRRNTGLHPQAVGLPQDALADCSRILANFYLQKYDDFAEGVCNQAGARYFRYADDQMILLNNPSKIENILLLLTRNLDLFGLRVNQKKVKCWTAAGLIAHRCRKIQAIFAKKGDNKNPKLVRDFAVAYLAIPLKTLSETWNGGMPLLNRLLFAELNTLPRVIFNKLMVRLLAEQYLFQATAEKFFRLNDLNSRRSKPINLNNRLSLMANKSVHNAFHHEVLAYSRKVKDVALEDSILSRIAVLDNLMSACVIE